MDLFVICRHEMLIVNNVYDGTDEYDNAYDGDDAIDARSGKEAAHLVEQAAKQLKQTFEDTADKGNDEGNHEHDDE
jgi:hypothetical protein